MIHCKHDKKRPLRFIAAALLQGEVSFYILSLLLPPYLPLQDNSVIKSMKHFALRLLLTVPPDVSDPSVPPGRI